MAARSASGKRAVRVAPPAQVPEPRRRGAIWRKLAIALAAAAIAGGAVFAARRPVERWWTERKFADARRLIALGQDGQAKAELAQVLRRNPSHREARLALAEVELRGGRVEHAFLELQAYTELAPEDPRGFVKLADLEEAAGQPAEVEAALTKALQADPSQPRLHGRRASLRLWLGKLRGALEDAAIAVRRDPRDVGTWIALCTATAAVRGPAAAQESVRSAIAAAGADPRLVALSRGVPAPPTVSAALDAGHTGNWPGDLGALVRDFSLGMRKSDWSGVATTVRSARERYPATFLGPWLEGIAANAQRDPERAERALLEALRLSPRSHRAVTSLIGVWSRQKGPEYTAERLVRLAQDDPGFTYPIPIAAHGYLEAAQPAKAEATIRTLFALLPNSPLPFRETADFFLSVDRASDALAATAQGLSRFPDDAELQNMTARAALSLGDRERAIRAYEEVLRVRPDDDRAAAQLARLLSTARTDPASHARALQLVHELQLDRPADAEVLAAMGIVLLGAGKDPRAARTWLLAARQAAPDEPSVRYQLALAYARSGDPALARKELLDALQSGRAFAEEAEARRLARELEGQSPR